MRELYIPNQKSLTRGEQAYFRNMVSGLDEQLLTAGEWLGSDEAKELFRLRQSEIDDFFQNSGIREQLNVIINNNAKDSETFIKRFYTVGETLGYKDIGKKLAYTPATKKALYHLTNYNFELVTNLNNQLANGIRERIFMGVASGQHPYEIARDLMNLKLEPIPIIKDGEVIRVISPRMRAEMIARTEHARAVNTGTLQAYSNYGVEKVDIITVGDSDVCTDCEDLENNNPYTLEEAMNLLPVHPNCRCSYGPVVEEPLVAVDDPLIVNLVDVSIDDKALLAASVF